MFGKYLLLIYQLYVQAGWHRSTWFERYLSFNSSASLSPDAEKTAYKVVFSKDCLPEMEELYGKQLNQMRGIRCEDASEILEALAFFQHISAVALWKYRLDVGERTEDFIRDFDRLDVSDERFRLHQLAQAS